MPSPQKCKPSVTVSATRERGQGSTARANGGIRAQWSTPVHIKFSNYSIEAYERFTSETGGECGLTPLRRRCRFSVATGDREQPGALDEAGVDAFEQAR